MPSALTTTRISPSVTVAAPTVCCAALRKASAGGRGRPGPMHGLVDAKRQKKHDQPEANAEFPAGSRLDVWLWQGPAESRHQIVIRSARALVHMGVYRPGGFD